MDSTTAHRPSPAGLTLIELVVVAAILVVLSGALVPFVIRYVASSRDTAAKTSLNEIRNAILGTPDRPGYFHDTGILPSTLEDLFANPFAPSDPLNHFDRETSLGWRGPYLVHGGGTYVVNPAKNFSGVYGNNGDPAVLDPWGNPLVLQRPTVGATPDVNENYARLISAGPNGILDTPPDFGGSTYPPANARGDDIVIFLLRADVP